MDFYIVMLPVLVASLIVLFHLRRMTKHDKVLYKFCQVRRDLMSLIREKNFALSKADYTVLRELADITDGTIHDFNNNKSTLFNVRKFAKFVKEIKTLGKKIDGRKYANPEVAHLYDHYSRTLVTAFFTFTPLIKSEVVLRIGPRILMALAKLGGTYLIKKVGRLVEVTQWVQEEAYDRRVAA